MLDYRVLARKYRPQHFDDLVGQDVLVRTLTNAIEKNRLAHAFLLTGIRGIGKTTTARIIAKALNCLGPENNYASPTISPCGVCDNCVAISEDRHVDVMEMDAASRTGVDDIRDIIETVHYAPTSARYKVYIIDEVHMLSKNAFNALLKTLEEPPPHVKFIFATTELRKIPVTILSRCQRFNLKRVDGDVLSTHLLQVCKKEDIQIEEEEGIRLIATAAEGSVRDALSILDQAIVHTDAKITGPAIRNMLGLTDKSRNFDIVEHLFSGDIKAVLSDYRDLYSDGADPLLLLQDLLQITHLITLLKVSSETITSYTSYSESELERGKKLSQNLSMSSVSLVWQMLLKTLDEARTAPHPTIAVEMAFVRITHAAQLPPPVELIKSIKKKQEKLVDANKPNTSNIAQPAISPVTANVTATAAQATAVAQPVPYANEQPLATLGSFEEAVNLFQKHREMLLYSYLTQDARLVSFRQGHIELNLPEHIPADTAGKIGKALSDWTGERWVISLSQDKSNSTLAEKKAESFELCKQDALKDRLVSSVIETFPGAQITGITMEGEDQ